MIVHMPTWCHLTHIASSHTTDPTALAVALPALAVALALPALAVTLTLPALAVALTLLHWL